MDNYVNIHMPDTEGESKSTVEKWLKSEGDTVAQHEPIVEISTDKVSLEVTAPEAGKLIEICKPKGSRVTPKDTLGKIQLASSLSQTSTPSPSMATEERPKSIYPCPENRLSPAVRRLVREYDVDLRAIEGSGKGGRITYRDVQSYLQQQQTQQLQTIPAPPTYSQQAPAFPTSQPPSQEPPSKMIPHTPMRRGIAQHMVQSMLQTAPHVTAVFEADLSKMIAHCRTNRESFQQQGVRLTYTAYFVHATVKALQEVPEVNSRWHDEGLELFNDCNIGVATALENGLIVPVILQAQNLSLMGIAQKLEELVSQARQGKLSPSSVQKGTFTISNHGVSGSLLATPIINQPQSAILGIGKIEKRVVVKEVQGVDSIQIRPMCYVTLTIDHRALDGFQANKFLSHFVDVLGSW